MVREAKDRLKIRDTPPSVSTSEGPEPVRYPLVEVFQTGAAIRRESNAFCLQLYVDGIGIPDDRGEGSATSVVALNQVEEELTICGFLMESGVAFRHWN